jgi:hypothetical protein
MTTTTAVWRYAWHTIDELAFIAGLKEKGNHVALRNYIGIADMHEWPATVNRAECLTAAREALENLG